MYKTLDTYYQEKLAFHLLTQHKIIFKGKTKASRDAYICQHKLDSGRECGFAHTERYIFQEHLRDKHYDSGIKHQCSICGSVYKKKEYLSLHVRNVHDQLRNHLCNDCGKGFVSSSKLNYHIAIHHAPCTEVCQLCPEDGKNGRKLYRALTLKEHMKEVHNKDKQCPLCDYATYQPNQLAIHYRTKHLKYLQFRCKTCTNSFTTIWNAKAHYQQVHLKNMDKILDKEYFLKHPDKIEDRAVTDPGYPTDERILEMMSMDRSSNLVSTN